MPQTDSVPVFRR